MDDWLRNKPNEWTNEDSNSSNNGKLHFLYLPRQNVENWRPLTSGYHWHTATFLSRQYGSVKYGNLLPLDIRAFTLHLREWNAIILDNSFIAHLMLCVLLTVKEYWHSLRPRLLLAFIRTRVGWFWHCAIKSLRQDKCLRLFLPSFL